MRQPPCPGRAVSIRNAKHGWHGLQQRPSPRTLGSRSLPTEGDSLEPRHEYRSTTTDGTLRKSSSAGLEEPGRPRGRWEMGGDYTICSTDFMTTPKIFTHSIPKK